MEAYAGDNEDQEGKLEVASVLDLDATEEIEEVGGSAMPLGMFTDSYSTSSSMEASHLKFPADKGTYLHLDYLREKIMNRDIRSLNRVDTREICVDGMTKVRLERSALMHFVAGVWKLLHATKSCG